MGRLRHRSSLLTVGLPDRHTDQIPVSVFASFSSVRGRSGEAERHYSASSRPDANAGERAGIRARPGPTGLDSVHSRRWLTSGVVDGGFPIWSALTMTADPSEYEKSMPAVSAFLKKMERGIDRTRATHAGQPYSTVRQALALALEEEGARPMVPQVVDELARQISERTDR